jgi:hypothetical protein
MKRDFDAERWMIDTATDDLRQFIGKQQLAVMREACKGEERAWFVTRMVGLAALIHAMPKTYEQDGKGDQAVAHLHYFTGSMDWYITECDVDTDGEGQIQAFGLANLGYGGELGYISIAELIEHGAELDLHFQPTTLEVIQTRKAA